MKKDILKTWTELLGDHWTDPDFEMWRVVCIMGMCMPGIGYPIQLIVTLIAKGILYAFKPISEWTVRHFSVYGNERIFVACADCMRIFLVTCIILAVVDFVITLTIVFDKNNKDNITQKDDPSCN